MVGDNEAMSLGNLLLQGFDLVVLELDNPATVPADKMIVVRSPQGRFVARKSVSGVHHRRQTGFPEKFDRPIDSGRPDPRIRLSDHARNFLGAVVTLRPEKEFSDDAPLASQAQPTIGEKVSETGCRA